MSDRPTISELCFVKEPAKTVNDEQVINNPCEQSKEEEKKDDD